MKKLIKKINEIKSTGALEYAVEAALKANNETLNSKVADAIQKKLEELKVYSGMLIGTGYDIDGDVYYILLMNDEGLEQCIIYNEDDYYRLDASLLEIDTMLPITITGAGILMQGNNEIKFNTALNTEYIDSYPGML